jgi:hypothetical protein
VILPNTSLNGLILIIRSTCPNIHAFTICLERFFARDPNKFVYVQYTTCHTRSAWKKDTCDPKLSLSPHVTNFIWRWRMLTLSDVC